MSVQDSLKKNEPIHDLIIDLLNSLSAVKGLSELDSKVVDEKALIAQALSVLIQNQDMERCSFFLYDGEQFLVNVTGTSCKEENDKEKKPYASLKFRLGEGVIGLAAQTKELQHCSNCQQDFRFSQDARHTEVILPGSLISAPVVVSGQLLGVLNISHPEADYFSDWHIRLLQIYRNMLGQLIANSRLLQKMEEQISSRTLKLEKALRDVKLLKDRYESLSMLDELTGLYNRRYFYAQIEPALAGVKRYGQELCLLILDVDYFKRLNDQYGHQCGDQMLMAISSLLKRQMREADILVRFGGEEFVVVFTNTSCSNGKLFAERIRIEIEKLCIEYGHQQVKTTVSIGVYCINHEHLEADGDNVDILMRNADIALYKAKANGRNRVEVFAQ